MGQEPMSDAVESIPTGTSCFRESAIKLLAAIDVLRYQSEHARRRFKRTSRGWQKKVSKQVMAIQQAEDLISIGAYQKVPIRVDAAIRCRDEIKQFLRREMSKN